MIKEDPVSGIGMIPDEQHGGVENAWTLRIDSLTAQVAQLTAERDAARDEVRRLQRTWPEAVQVTGLGKAAAALYELRNALDLTPSGWGLGRIPGYEPSYLQMLGSCLDIVERMIVPDWENARKRIAILAPDGEGKQ
jgi:hypothetical protein